MILFFVTWFVAGLLGVILITYLYIQDRDVTTDDAKTLLLLLFTGFLSLAAGISLYWDRYIQPTIDIKKEKRRKIKEEKLKNTTYKVLIHARKYKNKKHHTPP